MDELSQAMQMFAPEHWLCGEQLFLVPPSVVRRWTLPCLALLTARRMNVILFSKHHPSHSGSGTNANANEQQKQQLDAAAAGGAEAVEGVKHKKEKRSDGEEKEKRQKRESESANASCASGELTEPWFGTRYSIKGA